MNKKTVKRALLSLISGYAAAMLFLLVCAAVTSGWNDPSKYAIYIGVAAILIGSLACGIASRVGEGGAGLSLAVGGVYAGILFILSLILGKQSEISLGVRAVIFLAAAVICGLTALLPAKRKVKRSSGGKRDEINKYIENSR